MIRNEIIYDKIKNFYSQQCKVHITKIPNAKFPKGKFHNGSIGQVYDNKITFDDDVEGVIEILFIEIADIDKFRERENEE